MKPCNEVLSIYMNFSAIVHFRAASTDECISDALCQVLSKQGTLAHFSCRNAHAQNGVAERKHHHHLESMGALMLASFVPPHFGMRLFLLPLN